MITVIYDPFHNPAVPDGTTMMLAETIIAMEGGTDPEVNNRITVGTGLVIDALRVLVKKGEFPADQLKFEHNGITIDVDVNGRCLPWPAGFNDRVETYLCQL